MTARRPRGALLGRVIALAREGRSVKEIAHEIEAGPSYVRSTLRRHGFVRVVVWREVPPPLLEYVQRKLAEEGTA